MVIIGIVISLLLLCLYGSMIIQFVGWWRNKEWMLEKDRIIVNIKVRTSHENEHLCTIDLDRSHGVDLLAMTIRPHLEKGQVILLERK